MESPDKKKKKISEKKAVAMRYDPLTDSAPKVIAKGEGVTASRMKQSAKENDVEIVEDPALVETLSQVPLRATIPENLFRAVAAVFALVRKAEEKK